MKCIVVALWVCVISEVLRCQSQLKKIPSLHFVAMVTMTFRLSNMYYCGNAKEHIGSTGGDPKLNKASIFTDKC